MEIPNHSDLETAIGQVEASKRHRPLLSALGKRYPDSKFRLVAQRDGRSWHGGIVSAVGNERIADSYQSWTREAFESAGGDAGRVWKEHKDLGYLTTEHKGQVLYLSAPYSTKPDAFFQIAIRTSREVLGRPPFDPEPWSAPKDLQDLQHPFLCEPEHEIELTPCRYLLTQVTDVRRFLKKMAEAERANRQSSVPEMRKRTVQVVYFGDGATAREEIPLLDTLPADWLDAPKGEARLLRDWSESSAGRAGHEFCDHWALSLYDHVDAAGVRRLGFTPIWSDADGWKLPEIKPGAWKTDAFLMEKLVRFDRRAGFPMAWFFYLAHGNRVTYTTGKRVAQGIQAGRVTLPVHDGRVIMRWYENPYGF